MIPVGLLGAAGYIAILASWIWARFRKGGLAEYIPLAIFGMAFFGTLYSVYLTYLELYVIKAVCIWCLSSALIMTLIMLASLPGAFFLSGIMAGEERKAQEPAVVSEEE